MPFFHVIENYNYEDQTLVRSFLDTCKSQVAGSQYISRRALDLMEQLAVYKKMHGSHLSCIVFVKRRYVALILSILINHYFQDDIRAMHLVGQQKMLLKLNSEEKVPRNQKRTLEHFAVGTYQVIVATTVAEEGLDIRSCNLVIRFNPMETLSSYIQSKGRARHSDSKYVVMLEQDMTVLDNTYEKFKCIEKQLDSLERDETLSAPCKREASSEKSYTNERTGAKFTTQSAVQLLKYYCDLLPKDEYCDLRPQFIDRESTVRCSNGQFLFKCTLILPSCCPLKEMTSSEWMTSKIMAKKLVCFEACIELFLRGALNDYFVPAVIASSKPTMNQSTAASIPGDLKVPNKRCKIKVRSFPERQVSPRWSMTNNNDASDYSDYSDITIYVYETISSLDPDIRFYLCTRKHLKLNRGFLLDLRVGSRQHTVKVSELRSQSISLQQLSKFQSYFCFFMSSIIAGKHTEKMFAAKDVDSPIVAIPSNVFEAIINFEDLTMPVLVSGQQFRTLETTPETVMLDLKNFVVLQHNGSLVELVEVLRHVNLKEVEFIVGDENKGSLYYALLRRHLCDDGQADSENCMLCIFKRIINVKNVHLFDAQESVELEFRDIEVLYDGERIIAMKFQSHQQVDYCLDVFRPQYQVHIIPAILMRAGSVLPIILHECENYMIAQDCNEELIPEFRDPSAMAIALMTTNAIGSVDYERLEILGDRYARFKKILLYHNIFEHLKHYLLLYFQCFKTSGL